MKRSSLMELSGYIDRLCIAIAQMEAQMETARLLVCVEDRRKTDLILDCACLPARLDRES